MSSRGERGGALIITVLVSLAMTGLALVAVTTVVVETQLAQNHTMLKQAQYVAETGMMVTMQRIQEMGSSSLLRERQRLLSGDQGTKMRFTLRSFGEDAVFIVDPDNPEHNSLGMNAAEIDFEVEVESLRTAPPPPGHQINLDQPPQSLEVGLLATGRVGHLTGQRQESKASFSARRVWALVPVP